MTLESVSIIMFYWSNQTIPDLWYYFNQNGGSQIIVKNINIVHTHNNLYGEEPKTH